MVFETLTVRQEGAVLFAEIAAPPMNLLGTELIRDLVSLIQRAEADDGVQVLVFTSADPDYFISHVDVTRIKEYRDEAAKLTGEPSIAILFRYLSASRLVTIAQIEGRVRGAGSEFVLACEDYDAELAERYGWINRALPASELGDFVRSLAHRIAGFPAAARIALKDSINAITLAPADDFRRDSDLFLECARNPVAQSRIQAAMKRGFQTRDAEMDLARMVGDLSEQ